MYIILIILFILFLLINNNISSFRYCDKSKNVKYKYQGNIPGNNLIITEQEREEMLYNFINNKI